MNKMKNRESKKVLALLLTSLLVFSIAGVLAVHDGIAEASGVDEEPGEVVVSGNDKRKLVKVTLSPRRQFAENGFAEYKVIIEDRHEIFSNGDIDTDNRLDIAQTYTYTLSFRAREGTSGTFDRDEVVLTTGQRGEVLLTVETETEGVSVFEVTVEAVSIDEVISIAGAIFVSDEIPRKSDRDAVAYFIGMGFALSDDETKGRIVELKVLKKGEILSGKLRFGERNFRIEGTIFEDNLNFNLFAPNTNEKVGSFSGKVNKFGRFFLLKGTLENLEGKTWSLTAMAKRRDVIRSVISSGGYSKIEAVSIDEVISIELEDSEDADEIYVQPIRVEKRKFFNIFPNPWGKRALLVRVTIGDQVSDTFISENDQENIGGYEISVDSLEDEENLNIDVEKIM